MQPGPSVFGEGLVSFVQRPIEVAVQQAHLQQLDIRKFEHSQHRFHILPQQKRGVPVDDGEIVGTERQAISDRVLDLLFRQDLRFRTQHLRDGLSVVLDEVRTGERGSRCFDVIDHVVFHGVDQVGPLHRLADGGQQLFHPPARLGLKRLVVVQVLAERKQVGKGATQRDGMGEGHGAEVVQQYIHARVGVKPPDREWFGVRSDPQRRGAVVEIGGRPALVFDPAPLLDRGDPAFGLVQVDRLSDVVGEHHVGGAFLDLQNRRQGSHVPLPNVFWPQISRCARTSAYASFFASRPAPKPKSTARSVANGPRKGTAVKKKYRHNPYTKAQRSRSGTPSQSKTNRPSSAMVNTRETYNTTAYQARSRTASGIPSTVTASSPAASGMAVRPSKPTPRDTSGCSERCRSARWVEAGYRRMSSNPITSVDTKLAAAATSLKPTSKARTSLSVGSSSLGTIRRMVCPETTAWGSIEAGSRLQYIRVPTTAALDERRKAPTAAVKSPPMRLETLRFPAAIRASRWIKPPSSTCPPAAMRLPRKSAEGVTSMLPPAMVAFRPMSPLKVSLPATARTS